MKRGVSHHRGGWVCAFLALALGGCVLPNSHLPQGFSSSYYRALQGTTVIAPAEPTPVVMPPPVLPAE